MPELAPKTVVVLRALWLGDLLCAVPAWRALRAALPEAKISLIGLPWAQEFVERFSNYFDEFIPFPGWPGMPEQALDVAAIPPFLEQMQERQFGLALQMHGIGSGAFDANAFIDLLRAKRSGGFYLRNEFCPDPGGFLPYPNAELEVDRHLRLMEFLGVEQMGTELEFPVHGEDEREFVKASRGKLSEPYVCIHPGGKISLLRRKVWPISTFAEVGDALAKQGLRVVITGSEEERPRAQAVAQAMKAPALVLAGKTTIGALAALIAQARVLICNDTGVSQLADALEVPSVVLFLNPDAGRWDRFASRDRQLHRLVLAEDGEKPSVRDVLQQAAQLLAVAVPG